MRIISNTNIVLIVLYSIISYRIYNNISNIIVHCYTNNITENGEPEKGVPVYEDIEFYYDDRVIK